MPAVAVVFRLPVPETLINPRPFALPNEPIVMRLLAVVTVPPETLMSPIPVSALGEPDLACHGQPTAGAHGTASDGHRAVGAVLAAEPHFTGSG